VRQVVGGVLRRPDEVGGEPSVLRGAQPREGGEGARRRRRLRHRADAAHPRHDGQDVERHLADQDLLEAAEERRAHLGRADRAALDVERDLEVALDAVEGADDEAPHFRPEARMPGATSG
jgi:hypothetical protein